MILFVFRKMIWGSNLVFKLTQANCVTHDRTVLKSLYVYTNGYVIVTI